MTDYKKPQFGIRGPETKGEEAVTRGTSGM